MASYVSTFTGDGSEIHFTAGFPVLRLTDLAVVVGTSWLTLGTDYSVSGPTSAPVATLAVAPGVGVTVTLRSAVGYTPTDPAAVTTAAPTLNDTDTALWEAIGATATSTGLGQEAATRAAADTALQAQINALPDHDVAGDASGAYVTALGSTTARQLQVREADIVNVKDWGAVGDATFAAGMWSGTDDSAAIQAALTAGAGKIVFFPPGNYMKGPAGTLGVDGTTPALDVPSNTTVLGSPGSVVVNEYRGIHSLFRCNNTTGVTFDGMTFDGNHLVGWGTIYAPMLVEATPASDLTVKNCSFYRSYYGGLFVKLAADGVLIDGNYFYDCGVVRQAMQLAGAGGNAYGFRVVNNYVENCLGVVVYRAVTGRDNWDSVFANNVARNCAEGASFGGIGHLTICTNVFSNDGTGDYAMEAGGVISISGDSIDITITGNVVVGYAGSPASGIVANTGSGRYGLVISGNTIANLEGIGLASSGTGVSITGNQMYGMTGQPMSVAGQELTVIGNAMETSALGTVGIGIEDVTNGIISGNVVTGPGNSGVAISLTGTNTGLIVKDNVTTGFQTNWSERRDVTYSASITPNLVVGSIFEIDATDGNAFTINNPTNYVQGNTYTFRVKHGSGGTPMGTITWGDHYVFASAWANPTGGLSVFITFAVTQGNFFREMSRAIS